MFSNEQIDRFRVLYQSTFWRVVDESNDVKVADRQAIRAVAEAASAFVRHEISEKGNADEREITRIERHG